MDIKNIYLKPLINPKINVGMNYQADIPDVEIDNKRENIKKRSMSNKRKRKNNRAHNIKTKSHTKIIKDNINLKDDTLDDL